MSRQTQGVLARKGMHGLQRALRLGLTVVTEIWNYPTGDWVSSVYAADIDGDGDIEVLLGSRDGNIYVLTKRGMLKKKQKVEGEWIRTIRGVVNADVVGETQIVAGLRDGKVVAYNEYGTKVWTYYAGHVVRQVRIVDVDRDGQNEVLLASEDQHIHALSCTTGELIWKYRTGGWVHTVHITDLDQDGKKEILAGSGDKHLYVLNSRGELCWRYDAGSEIQSVYASDIDNDGTIEILIATDGKELQVITAEGQPKWSFPAENRILSLAVADLDDNGRREIIAASEDKHIYILNDRGKLLWKHNLNSRVFSVYALDLDNDGLLEILAGTEDSLHVLRIEIMDGLYDKILSAQRKVEKLQAIKPDLAASEAALLQDLIDERSPNEPLLTLEVARNYIQRGQYSQALSALVLLNQQRVQQLWAQRVGRVRSVFSGDLDGDGHLELIAGTDDSGIYVLNTEGNEIWSYTEDDRIGTVYVGDIDLDGNYEVVAGSGRGGLYVLSNTGQIKWQTNLGDRVESIYINEADNYAEMVVGLRGSQGGIRIYGSAFEDVIEPIKTPHGVRIVGTYDLDGDGVAEIIAGGDDAFVYAYARDGRNLWSYKIGDRARGLIINDIDGDGNVEIIVGSEDRNVHILDSKGHLRWRYYTPHRVLSVNTLDLDLDGEIEVFLGTDEGHVISLNKTGDPLWKYKVGDRVCGVQAADYNQDGKIEIIVGSEDRMLYFLQVLDQQELSQEMERCWQELQRDKTEQMLIQELAQSSLPSLRSFAIGKIASQQNVLPQDFALLQSFLRDTSGVVRTAFARGISAFYLHNPATVRKYMDTLLSDQERDVRLALVDSLPMIAQIDENVGFQYLERFIRSVDSWVRRSVVRKLDQLAATSPERVFRLLLKLIRDDTRWIREEAARTLTHYFELHDDRLIEESCELIMQNSRPEILEIIADYATKATVRSVFLVFHTMLTKLDEHNMQEHLAGAVNAFRRMRALKHGDALYLLYSELDHLHRMRTLGEIAGYKSKISQEIFAGIDYYQTVAPPVIKLVEVAGILATYTKREGLGDRLASLLEAYTALEKVSGALERDVEQAKKKGISIPERLVLETLLLNWRKMVVLELDQLRGRADLKLEMRTKSVYAQKRIGIWLDIRNEGRSPADNVRVVLKGSPEFEILDKDCLIFETVPASGTVPAEFAIATKVAAPRLLFELTYADAESRNKALTFGDRLIIHEREQSFTRISNPYATGTPIQTRDMFYGRKEDLAVLSDDLGNISSNMVVVLYGQRRSGKSSLLYQLRDHRELGLHIPVYIDLQRETLKMSTGRLLCSVARAIRDTLEKKDLHVTLLRQREFERDPTFTFDQFLDEVEWVRGERKLIIMIDEFEVLEQKVADGVLEREIFEYLRSLMQHRRGVNFLLAGTHKIEQLTKDYWSVFFNIARHHRLNKLHPQDSRELITHPVKESLEYDPLAVEKIRLLAADQPYFIQLICRSLVAHCNKLRKSYVTISDVATVQARVMETGQIHFQWLWGKISLQQRFALAAVAQEGGEEGRSLSLKEVEEIYRRYKLPYQHEVVLNALENLTEEDVIERVSEGTRFKVPTGLTRTWLREAKTLKRVMLEENLLAY